MTEKRILNIDEAVSFLNVSKSWMYKKTSNKVIPFSKPNNGKLYFLKEDLENWMLSNRSNSESELRNEIVNKITKNGKA